MTLKFSTGILIAVMLGFAVAVSAPAKEWAIVTLADMPDYSIAGRPLKLTFFVRQNGQTLRTGLRPQVRATTATGLTVKANALAGTSPGEYTAILDMAQTGDSTIVIASGFSDSVLKLDIQPAPQEIGRVFVGRMELITPEIQNDVRQAMARNDRNRLMKYGRFLEPIAERIGAKNRLLDSLYASTEDRRCGR